MTTKEKPQDNPSGGLATMEAHEDLYQIILFDDNEHSYQYVIEMLTTLFDLSAQDAQQIAYEVDYVGQATVKVCELEEATSGRDRILAYGPDPRVRMSTTSMHAIVEAVEGHSE